MHLFLPRMKSMDIFPILKSRFVPNNIRSYWQKFDNIKINDIFELVERKYASEDINSFLVGIIDEENENIEYYYSLWESEIEEENNYHESVMAKL